MYYDFYICHGGPGSGRYPLGSGDRPYQHKRLGFFARRRMKKQLKNIANDAKQNRKIMSEKDMKEARAEMEVRKQRAIQSGTASEILRFQGQLTNKELQDAYNRIDYERKLTSFAQDEMDAKIKKFNHFMGNVKTYTNWVDTGISAWNDFAAIYNTINPESKLRSVNKGSQPSQNKK